jgi:hypothetical protein
MGVHLLSKAVGGVVLAVAASTAAAATINLGSVFGTTPLSRTFNSGANVSTIYEFTTLAGEFSGVLVNPSSPGFINNWTVTMNGPSTPPSIVWAAFTDPLGAFRLRFNTSDLQAGTYTLTVVGTAGASGSAFSGSITTPVPEPHEWAMMLAGLGLVAWVARRRKKDDTGGGMVPA